mmetsp:Transcript_33153/g.80493  ORF Transcript_33153/g.80493 Transcript_33153/m.80493 type:complete len:159 (+) Transcript_33153:74-550(+)|eukprot:CAMPEP_0113500196 /NCGR_PEP_ID=MMETSP0014_2-20120614/32174_1 /TAXON_ID=2857 /ORGANISM="Nitzschia sp." /LENGTH=158 /DNA_ID=CAMNT_0000394465 /DNA_START=17 /DNA_END=493 /DNA_ORIENTATION=+ /assembly_acc=CAM_ASM_000159
MSLSFVTTSFIGLVGIGIGSGLPALALVMGYPRPVTDGLGSTIENFDKSKEAKLGLYLYTVSDILLGGLCTISVVMSLPNNNYDATNTKSGPTVGVTVTQTTALVAIACHQFGYLAAAVPAFGGVRNVATFWSSLITGTVSAGLAAWVTYHQRHRDDY